MLNGANGLNGVEAEETIVSFSGRGLKLDQPSDADPIVAELNNKNTTVTCIDLSGNTLGITAAEPLGDALRHTQKLKRCLLNDLFTGRLKTEIAPALRHLSAGIISSGAQLVELDLCDNAFGPNGVVGVVDLLSSPACFTLKILRMNNQGLGHDGCRYLTQALLKGREACGKRGLALTVFSAGRNRLENVGAQMLADVFTDMGSLEELSLYQNGIGIHGKEGSYSLSKIIKGNPKLRVLNLSDNTLAAEGGKIIAKSLRSLENLEELHLGDCILRASGAQALAAVLDDPKVAPNLRVLNLPGNEITCQAGISLVLSLGSKSKLEVLDLNANEFGQSGIKAIIRSLESIDLLHTLIRTDGSYDDEELVGDELYARAFDEDQGSASESEEAEGEEEVEYSHEDVLGSEEEYNSEHGYDSEGDDEPQSSFITVKEQPSSTGFSFRDLHATLSQSQICSPNKQSSPQVRSGPFGGAGLFSTISNQDSTTTTTTRSNAWPPAGLFASAVNQNAPIRSGNLFSPPILSQPIEKPTVQTNETLEKHLNEFELQLKKCLQTKPDETSVLHFADIIKSIKEDSESLYVPKIASVTKSVAPERVIRLGLRLSHQLPHPLPAQFHPLCLIAANLLASVLVLDPNQIDLSETNVSRAVNCLLVYLGAVKAEPESEDYEALHSCKGEQLERHRAGYFYITRYMFNLKNPFPPRVRNSLNCLLSEQKNRQLQDASGAQPPSSNHQTQQLRDELLDVLETQLADLRL